MLTDLTVFYSLIAAFSLNVVAHVIGFLVIHLRFICMHVSVYVNKDLTQSQTLTSDFKLAVLSGAEHWVSQAEPWQLLAELRQEIVCNEAYYSSQDVQDEAKSRLRIKSKKINISIKNVKCVGSKCS